MKIAIYAISKNEEQFVKRFCESAKEADLIVIADTGSTDKTVEIAKECGATVYDICITPWRFDKARDAALALLPRDIDVCVSLDLDEELQPGWRQEIERLWQPDTTRMGYKFDWGHGKVFYSTKLHSRSGYHWHHPCHEYIRADARTNEKFVWSDMLMVVHKPDETKSRGQYMDLLEMSVKEDPLCPRNAFYYARELTYYSRWEEAIVALKKYLEMPEATWNNERAYAMRLIGDSYEALGRDGLEWYRKGVAEDPKVRETWIALASATQRRNLWSESFGAALSALAITERNYSYTATPDSFSAKPHDLAALAAYYLGLKEEALKHGLKAVELEPTNQRLIKNLKFYKE
jgi:glycosyltransferase involved in cell wall biosynthesis